MVGTDWGRRLDGLLGGRRLVAAWLVLALTVSLASTATAADAEAPSPDGPRGVYLGLDYFTPLGDTGMHDMLYPIPGLLWQEGPAYFEARSFLVVGLPDALAAAVDFLGGGDGDMPVWEGLNNGDPNPGCLKMMEFGFRWAFLQRGALRLDAGGLFDLWWMSPAVKGVHFGNLMWNLGPSVGLGLAHRDAALNLALSVGNGFSNSSNLNPFVGTEAFARLRVWRWLGLYLRGQLRVQSQDYSGFSPNDPSVSDRDFDIRVWRGFVSGDGGVMVLF